MIILPLLLVALPLAAWMCVPVAVIVSYVHILRKERYRERRWTRQLTHAFAGWALTTVAATLPIAGALLWMILRTDLWSGPAATATVLSAPVIAVAGVVVGEWRLHRATAEDA